MKQTIKRMLSAVLAAVMALGLFAGFAATNVQATKQYGVFSGTIKTVNPVEANGNQTVFVESTDGQQANIIITPNTARVTGNAPAVGAGIIAIYDATAPMIMIYPPQYPALAVAIGMDGKSIKIDRFDKNGLSSDGSLVIRTSADTKIVTPDGKTYTGSLADKTLLIVYDIVLESYPMQTGPELVIVMNDIPAINAGDVGSKPIVVNGKTVKAPKAFLAKNGTVMVPLTSISKALGVKVVYFGNSSKAISFRVGRDSYKIPGQKERVSLGTPSVYKRGTVYVPLDFFTVVLYARTAVVTDTQIVIDKQ